jgi:hypothetical protein
MESFTDFPDSCLWVLSHNDFKGLETVIQRGFSPAIRQPVLNSCLGRRRETRHDRDMRYDDVLKLSRRRYR